MIDMEQKWKKHLDAKILFDLTNLFFILIYLNAGGIN